MNGPNDEMERLELSNDRMPSMHPYRPANPVVPDPGLSAPHMPQMPRQNYPNQVPVISVSQAPVDPASQSPHAMQNPQGSMAGSMAPMRTPRNYSPQRTLTRAVSDGSAGVYVPHQAQGSITPRMHAQKLGLASKVHTHTPARSMPQVRYSNSHMRNGSAPRTPQMYAHPQSNYIPHLRPANNGWRDVNNAAKEQPYRRANSNNGYTSPLIGLTTSLPSTYNLCDPSFQYSKSKNPRRVLTEPHDPTLNDGFDNSESDYILYVNDILGTEENRKYLALNILGKGTFGQVVKCQNMVTKEIVAVKVIKNKPAFLNQSLMEVSILEHLTQFNSELLCLKDRFMHKQHLCLVFELLGSNLYEVIKKNNFKGLDINVVRIFVMQLLHSLSILKGAQLIHCDLKPENILLRSNDNTAVQIIDFGSACHERQTVYTYIQSRFYRSPEVLLGLPYTSAIDMWSLGCIIAELFLGLPVFPGSSEYDQLSRIVQSLGYPPAWMMDMGKNTKNFMVQEKNGSWRMRTIKEQNIAFKSHEKEGKKYFSSPDIRATIMSYPCSRTMSKPEFDEEMRQRELLSDFVLGLLTFNPFERWTPQQALMHPFVAQLHQQHLQMQQQMQQQQNLQAQQAQHQPLLKKTNAHRAPVRLRANTVGQVQSSVPVPIQQAAARVDPGDMHRENTSYAPLREQFDHV